MNEITDTSSTPQIGRNEPCPCGSGKKYKRCHGVNAAPKITAPKAGGPAGLGGMNAEAMNQAMGGMDPQWMTQFSQALQRLPRGQMQRLQAIMQKAMSGKDVSQEASEFEKTLPVDLQQMMMGFKMPPEMAAAMGGDAPTAEGEMTPEEAKAIVAAAVQQGKISSEEADKLLTVPTPPESSKEESSKLGKFFGFGKKGK